MYILLCGYAPFSGNCGLDCGWERGESCTDCQEMLFASIKEREVVFSEQHWGKVSNEAKDLIKHLLVRDSSVRLDAEQVLDHPWIVNCGSSNILQTPSNLKRQLSINDLEDFASRAMAVNRAVEEDDNAKDAAITTPHFQFNIGSMSFERSSSDHFSLNLLQRRRRSKELFSKFSSIDELDNDFFMKTVY